MANILTIFRENVPVDAAQTITWSVGGTAVYGTDYVAIFPPGITGTFNATGGSVVLPQGQDSVDIELRTVEDTLIESDDSIIISVTGGTPFILPLLDRRVCGFTLGSDDTLVALKVYGVGPTSTALIGNLSVVADTPFKTANTGPPPPEQWPSWLVGGLSGGIKYDFASSYIANAAISIKLLIRAPIGSSALAGDERYIIRATNAALFSLQWERLPGGVGWNLSYRTSVGITEYLPSAYSDGEWLEVFVTLNSVQSAVYAVRIGTGVFEEAESGPSSSVSSSYVGEFQETGFAALSVEWPQVTRLSMTPLLPQNL